MNEACCPINYLGVVIGMKMLPCATFNPLLDKIRNKLASWKGRLISFASKFTFIQSVLQSISVYFFSSGWVPKSMLERIEGYCRRFLWSRDGEHLGWF